MKPLFAILHKPTGYYLPEPLGRMGRGGSHTEPVDCSGDINPRLFTTKLAASRALTAWLQGKFNAEKTWEGDGSGGGYYVDDLPSVTHQPHRKKEDMEIIQVFLQPIKKGNPFVTSNSTGDAVPNRNGFIAGRYP